MKKIEPLLNDYRNLIKTFPSCIVAHIFREANRCTDKLANIGATQVVNFLLLYEPPHVVVDLLAFDKAKLFCNRMLVVQFYVTSLVNQKKKKQQPTIFLYIKIKNSKPFYSRQHVLFLKFQCSKTQHFKLLSPLVDPK